jgi:two-component system, response regulator PdtaR
MSFADVVLAYPASSHTRFAPVHFPHDRTLGDDMSDSAKILIVEDDYLAASEIEDVLREAGYEIVGIVDSAPAAVKLARSETPTLIIMDIRLIGRADGVDAALEIFRDTGIRCIFATAHCDAGVRARAQAADPLGWLPKPYAPHALIAMVRHAVAKI